MTNFVVKNHVVYKDGKPVEFKPTPNRGGVIKPSLLVMHYTAGFTAGQAINTLVSRAAKASAHLVIERDGTVTQLAPLNISTWHAGKSAWKGRQMCNGFSIGIELVNCGPLIQRADGKLVAEVAQRKVIPAADAVEGQHPNGEKTKFWQVYPEEQMEAAIGVAHAICAEYGIRSIVGHYDIAPTRKRDPGPAFPMASFRAAVLGRESERQIVKIVSKKTPDKVIEKPREEITAADLREAGSRTIKGADQAQTGAIGTAASGVILAATQAKELTDQATATIDSVKQTAETVSQAKDTATAAMDVWGWVTSHPAQIIAVVALLAFLYFVWRSHRGAAVVVEARTSDARDGVNVRV